MCDSVPLLARCLVLHARVEVPQTLCNTAQVLLAEGLHLERVTAERASAIALRSLGNLTKLAHTGGMLRLFVASLAAAKLIAVRA